MKATRSFTYTSENKKFESEVKNNLKAAFTQAGQTVLRVTVKYTGIKKKKHTYDCTVTSVDDPTKKA